MNMIYDIQVKVPLGIRKGVLRLWEDHGIVEGELDLLGFVEKVNGFLDEDRCIHLKGNITSTTRCIPYIGVGNIRNEIIHMKLVNGKECYQLTGKLFEKKEGDDES